MFLDNDDAIAFFENLVDGIDWKDSTALKLMRAARSELTELGMHSSYRDQMVAYMEFSVSASLTEEQENRLVEVTRKLVRNFYTAMKDEEYNDEAISIMARHLSISLS